MRQQHTFSCFLNDLVLKSFKRLPTATEWTRFREYARRMRVLVDFGTSNALSSDVYSIMQRYTINEPLLPNLTTLGLWGVGRSLIAFLPLFLSPRIISITFGSFAPSLPKSVVASVIRNLPTPCPNLREINFHFLPSDPIITAAISSMFFATNQNALQEFHANSPLTEEASEAVYKSQNLRGLSVVIEKGTSIPSVSLPNLTRLEIGCDDGSDGLQLLRGATFGKLEFVSLDLRFRPIGDFLESFKDAALSSYIHNTLSAICLFTECSWDPNYSSLLPFTRLVDLSIRSPCNESCSRVDDNTVIDLSRAIPLLETLSLGYEPCHSFTGGVTAKGLAALARNCPNLSSLCVHFQVASLCDPPTGLETTHSAGCSASWTGCVLTEFEVGDIPVPEDSASTIALTLLRIFPRIKTIRFDNDGWIEVQDMIRRSKRIVGRSSK